MAGFTVPLNASDLSIWSERLAAEDWSWLTYKYLLGDAVYILLWLAFLTTLISILLPKSRRRLAVATRVNVNGVTICSGFIFTWLAGAFAWSAMFGPGPYGYWLYQLLGANLFASVSEWTFRYMTLLGCLSW